MVPGIFSTYWIKHLTWIRALTQEDKNFWMDPAYRIPDTPKGNTTPDDVAAGKVNFIPIGRVKMPVRSFIVTPDGSGKLPVGLPVVVQGIAFSGDGEDHGPYSFRTWQYTWTPRAPAKYLLAVRATDAKGHVQSDEGVWNPGGYLWNKVERQDVIVGSTS